MFHDDDEAAAAAEEELRMTTTALQSLDRGSPGPAEAATGPDGPPGPQPRSDRRRQARRKRRLSWTGGAEDSRAESLVRAGGRAGDPVFDSYLDPATGRRGKPGTAFTFASAEHFASVLSGQDSGMVEVARRELDSDRGSGVVRSLLARAEVYRLPAGVRPREMSVGIDESEIRARFADTGRGSDAGAELQAQLRFGRSFHRLSAQSSMSRLESAARLLRSGDLVPGSGLLSLGSAVGLAASPSHAEDDDDDDDDYDDDDDFDDRPAGRGASAGLRLDGGTSDSMVPDAEMVSEPSSPV